MTSPAKTPPAAASAQTTLVTEHVQEIRRNLPDGSEHEIVRLTKLVQYERELDERHKRTPPGWEIAFGVALICAWVILFGGGIFVPTAAYRETLLGGGKGLTVGVRLEHAVTVILFYTVTNIFFLSLISSCIGCMTCRWRVTGKIEGLMGFYAGLHWKRIYLAALLRGFFLYLMVISGFLVLSTEDAIIKTGFAQYIRVAGLTSILGFMVGFDPQIAYRLMGKLNDLANQPLRPLGDGKNRRPAEPTPAGQLADAAKSEAKHPA